MIIRNESVDKIKAFEEACKDNNIVLTENKTNNEPVAYIDAKGHKKNLNLYKIFKNKIPRRDGVHLNDIVRIIMRENNNEVKVVSGKVVNVSKNVIDVCSLSKKIESLITVDIDSPHIIKIDIIGNSRIGFKSGKKQTHNARVYLKKKKEEGNIS